MPHHVVVDGSNIATEGRHMPSLAQLNEAVMAFMDEHPDALITVVVDATFGHRIDSKEVKEFDEAVANNELVAPPAGAVGRGDAFVLSIANKVKATILSNDSFQEFHPQYEWLFDEGRLIGGKPVPHIGWVFVPRVPVRGQVSRSAMKDAKRKRAGAGATSTVRTGSPEASLPMPVPKAPPPGLRNATKRQPAAAASPAATTIAAAAAAADQAPTPTKGSAVNDLLTFLSFVEHHPVGSSVNAVVESYSSHGAYVRIGDVKAYVPLRLMADPPPRSAREFMKIGDAITLVVDSFAPARRSIDLATAAMATTKPADVAPKKAASKRAAAPAKPRGAKKAAATADVAETAEAVPAAVVAEAPAPAKRRTRKATAEPTVTEPSVEPSAVAAPDAPVAAAPAKKARAAKKAAPQPATDPAPATAPKKATRARAKAAAPELPLEIAPVDAPAAPAKRARAKKAASAPAPTGPAAPEPVAPAAARRRRSS